MPSLRIFLDGSGMLDDVPDKKNVIHVKDTIKIGALFGGMASGKPSIAFGITLPNGQVVLAETSMLLFQTAAKAFAAKYGWQDEQQEGTNRI